MFDYPTIAEICRYLEDEGWAAVDPMSAGTVPTAAAAVAEAEQDSASTEVLRRMVLDAVKEVLGGGDVTLEYDAPLMSSGACLTTVTKGS